MPTLKDILARKGSDVATMAADASVLDAARLMNERGIGGVVITRKDKVIGIFTERDILRRVVAEQRDPATTRIEQVMTTPVVAAHPDAPLSEIIALVTNKRIRHIPVMDGDALIGIVTSGDLLAFQVKEQQDQIELLHSYVYDIR